MKKIYIPSNLDLRQEITKEYHNDAHVDRMYYIIHLIYEQRLLYKIEEEYVPLKAIYLRRLLGRATEKNGIHNYNVYTNILTSAGVIECDRHYIVNEKSFGYKLCDKYANVRHKQVQIASASLQTNLDRWYKCHKPSSKVHKHIYDLLTKIEIDYTESLKAIDHFSTEEYNCAKIHIDKIHNKDFYIRQDEYGRVHTNLTNLESSLRKFLTYGGKKLANIDIANSQPLISLMSILSKLTPYDVQASDVLCYKRLVERGELYEYLMEKTGKTDRNEFKENFFRRTFFGKKTSSLFCELFPTIGREIKKIKRTDYRRLAWMMQRKESKLIITKICGRIMREHPEAFIGTIHDSILTTPENVSTIRQIMSEEFEKIGLSPTIRIDRYE